MPWLSPPSRRPTADHRRRGRPFGSTRRRPTGWCRARRTCRARAAAANPAVSAGRWPWPCGRGPCRRAAAPGCRRPRCPRPRRRCAPASAPRERRATPAREDRRAVPGSERGPHGAGGASSLTAVLPKDGLPMPTTFTELPDTFSGRSTGSSSPLPDSTPGEPCVLPAACAPPPERLPAAAADSSAAAPACRAGRAALLDPDAPDVPDTEDVADEDRLAHALPDTGFSRPTTLIVSPHTFTGTCTGTSTELPDRTPGEPAVSPSAAASACAYPAEASTPPHDHRGDKSLSGEPVHTIPAFRTSSRAVCPHRDNAPEGQSGHAAGQFHPNGFLLPAGCDSRIFTPEEVGR